MVTRQTTEPQPSPGRASSLAPLRGLSAWRWPWRPPGWRQSLESLPKSMRLGVPVAVVV